MLSTKPTASSSNGSSAHATAADTMGSNGRRRRAMNNVGTTSYRPAAHVAAIAAFTLGSSLNLWLNTPDDYAKIGAPYVPGTTTYSPAASESFYGARPFLVAKRVLKLATLTSAFNTGILFDWLVLGELFKDEEYTALKKAEPARAKVALRLAEQLGPTFIKLG